MNSTDAKLLDHCLRAHFGEHGLDTDEESNSSSEGNASLDEEFFRLQPSPVLQENKRAASPKTQNQIEVTKKPNISAFQTSKEDSKYEQRKKGNFQSIQNNCPANSNHYFAKPRQPTNTTLMDNMKKQTSGGNSQPPQNNGSFQSLFNNAYMTSLVAKPQQPTNTLMDNMNKQTSGGNSQPPQNDQFQRPFNNAYMTPVVVYPQQLANNPMDNMNKQTRRGNSQPPENNQFQRPFNNAYMTPVLVKPQQLANNPMDNMNKQTRRGNSQPPQNNQFQGPFNNAYMTPVLVKPQQLANNPMDNMNKQTRRGNSQPPQNNGSFQSPLANNPMDNINKVERSNKLETTDTSEERVSRAYPKSFPKVMQEIEEKLENLWLKICSIEVRTKMSKNKDLHCLRQLLSCGNELLDIQCKIKGRELAISNKNCCYILINKLNLLIIKCYDSQFKANIYDLITTNQGVLNNLFNLASTFNFSVDFALDLRTLSDKINQVCISRNEFNNSSEHLIPKDLSLSLGERICCCFCLK